MSKLPLVSPTADAREVVCTLTAMADPARAQVLQRFFKTGPGQYGAGDQFLGIRVPDIRRLVRQFAALPLGEGIALLHSPFHEARLLALLIWVRAFQHGDEALRESIYRSYLANTGSINSWDLVDASAEHIVGAHLKCRSRAPLHALAASASLWERRIAILATFHFIRAGEFAETLAIARLLLDDREDLIHKAVGWMLREVGKRDLAAEMAFLNAHCRQMPRTMLRYAIERFPEAERQRYLRGAV